MAELASTRLDPDAHLLLDQPLLRLPHELLRKNLKSAQRQIELSKKSIDSSVDSLKPSTKPDDALAAIDATLAKAQNLKRKLEALHEEERVLHRQQKARVEHLNDLHGMNAVTDVGFEKWSSVRLDRLLVDYLLGQNYTATASSLARSSDIEDLVDIPTFSEASRISASLLKGETSLALAWCSENKQALKKIGMPRSLEMELRLQQFIEMRRAGESGWGRALEHARKYLIGGEDGEAGLKAGGLLIHDPGTRVEPYASMYAPGRSKELSTLFLTTWQTLYSLPPAPLLHTALTAGLSALKTPTCHSIHRTTLTAPSLSQNITGTNLNTGICPICSTELNELARNVPYAHHSKSHMEDDPVVLPNGRVFGRERLRALNEKLGVPAGRVRDPTEGLRGVEWDWDGGVRKVFIS